mmetsp:Transcript_25408/g.48146  ORF Transcript_25408/g.48146 Transcript_25408/m.48146 type:complete len:120 (+) Transcript_25408:183-542(+)
MCFGLLVSQSFRCQTRTSMHARTAWKMIRSSCVLSSTYGDIYCFYVANATDFPLEALHFSNFSNIMSGVTDGSACTTTVLDATSALTDWTPSIFPKIRLTAPEQPSQVIPTINLVSTMI